MLLPFLYPHPLLPSSLPPLPPSPSACAQIKRIYPNGDEESRFPDGTVQRVALSGERVVEFPNKQKVRASPFLK